MSFISTPNFSAIFFNFEKYNSLSLIFNQQVVARVKKINKKDLSSGNTTKRSNQIVDQTYKLFPEIKDFTFVDLG